MKTASNDVEFMVSAEQVKKEETKKRSKDLQ